MLNLIRCNWIRRSGNFWTGILLMFVALLSCSTPASAYNSSSRRIQVDLSDQRLYAWEGKNLVYSMRVSTGKRSTPTRTGRFTIQTKLRATRMRGTNYNIPNVPYTMYYSGGYAIHGAYWHNRFGRRVSRGCVNLPVRQARKLYNWASVGTRVVVNQ